MKLLSKKGQAAAHTRRPRNWGGGGGGTYNLVAGMYISLYHG